MVGDENKKKEMLEKVAKESTPKFFTKLAKILEQRGGEYFAGNEVSTTPILSCCHCPFKSCGHMAYYFFCCLRIFSIEDMAHKVLG